LNLGSDSVRIVTINVGGAKKDESHDEYEKFVQKMLMKLTAGGFIFRGGSEVFTI